MAEWERVTPAAHLLAEHGLLQPGERGVVLGCGHAAAAAALAMSQAESVLWLMDTNFIALQAAARTLQANQVENARVWPEIELPQEALPFDVCIIELPKGRQLIRRWLVQAWQGVRPGGQMLLAGAKDLGVQAALQDASELFAGGTILDYKKGNRVAQFSRASAPASRAGWWDEPGIAPGTWLEFDLDLPGERPETVRLACLPGVFSAGRLDEGTALLLDHLKVIPGERVLDVGCGYGIIGLWAARAGAGWVDLVDANLLAVASTRRNLEQMGIRNAEALASDALSAVQGRKYSLIASNPPFHAGKGVDYQMAEAFIRQSWQALERGGRLVLVANQFIRYERLIGQVFGRVKIAAENPKYHLLVGEK